MHNYDNRAYREELEKLVNWCGRNNFFLNIKKANHLIVNFRKSQNWHSSLISNIVIEAMGIAHHTQINLDWEHRHSEMSTAAVAIPLCG